jgi:hypothetical protein
VHIVTLTFECGGFDVEMMRGGMSLSAWHQAQCGCGASPRASPTC